MNTKAIVVFDLTVILKLVGYSPTKFKIEQLLSTEFFYGLRDYNDILVCDVEYKDDEQPTLARLGMYSDAHFQNSARHINSDEILEKDLYFIHYDGMNINYYLIKFKG